MSPTFAIFRLLRLHNVLARLKARGAKFQPHPRLGNVYDRWYTAAWRERRNILDGLQAVRP